LDKYQAVRGGDEACAFERLLLAAERNGQEPVTETCRAYVEQGHPETPLILEALARAYLRQYRLPEARGCLGLWLEKEPDNPQALSLKGQLHLDYEQMRGPAVESYRRAVEIDPEHEEARLGLAVSLLESKLYAEAVEHLEFLTGRQPENLRVRVGLAECRYALGDPAAADRLLDPVLAEQPGYAPALALRGQMALQAGRYEVAEPCLRQAVLNNPRDPRVRHNLVVCLRQTGHSGEADEQERQLQQRQADLKRFHELATQEMGARPNDPALHTQFGELLLRSDFREEGLRWLHSALRLDPQYAPARDALAKYHQAGK
jgi:tetratricopeptide (TPR) repeat protein